MVPMRTLGARNTSTTQRGPTMKHTLALAALCVLMTGATAVNAKEVPLGQLISVTGNVIVGGTDFMNKATTGTPLYAGNTVLVSSNAKATIVMPNGCTIQLAPAQHLRIAAGLKCSQLQASVKQLFSPYQVAQAPVPGSSPIIAPPGTPVLAAGQVVAAPLLPAVGILPIAATTLGFVGLTQAVNNQTPTSGS
jgi:hypothetical protein